MAANYIRGNDGLAKALANPERRARIDAIGDEMDQLDRADKMGLPSPPDTTQG